ncbi:hypothetical protein QQS21_012362 [Conoideocrella luteorostrata]|uniref:Uncharacterized protein n=1 Tax=Conoideocrella luteorostrata TaxID=1105319 RepID=A0AAJ0CBB4_9HYPO|nr:hypothetical protein QQS21_012362 [Conoideocrella luteorostrata]
MFLRSMPIDACDTGKQLLEKHGACSDLRQLLSMAKHTIKLTRNDRWIYDMCLDCKKSHLEEYEDNFWLSGKKPFKVEDLDNGGVTSQQIGGKGGRREMSDSVFDTVCNVCTASQM